MRKPELQSTFLPLPHQIQGESKARPEKHLSAISAKGTLFAMSDSAAVHKIAPRRSRIPATPSRLTISIQVAVGLAIFISAALAQGYDLSWDVLNYHFYNGFAATHQKIWSNIQVAMRQTYFNPLLDIAFYILVVTVPAMMVAVVLAMVQSLVYPLLFLLSYELLAPLFPSLRWLLFTATSLTIVGIIAPVNVLEVGSAYGDNTSAVLTIAALLSMVRAINHPNSPRHLWRSVASGALAGLATGLKLTNMPFAIGIMAGFVSRLLLANSIKETSIVLRSALLAGCGMTAMLLLLYGWWGALLLAKFGNPFFPNFNHIFNSDYAAPSAFSDPAFALPNLHDKLLFPFAKIPLFGPLNYAGLFDLRMTVALPMAIIGLFACLTRSWLACPNWRGPRLESVISLFVFFLIAYFTWLIVFPINRYIVTLEFLAPVVCAMCVACLTSRSSTILVVSLTIAVALPSSAVLGLPLMWRPTDRRFGDGSGYFGVSFQPPVQITQGGALIVLLGDKPTTFLIPFFPLSTDFVRLQGSLFYESPGFDALGKGSDRQLRRRAFGNAMGRAICKRLTAQRGPLYALRPSPREDAIDKAALDYYGLALETANCRSVLSKAVGMNVELCPATRLAQPECEQIAE